jgi:hypothetical protein
MDAMRMADVAARVVAWHNRHPLARRITPADIGPVGIVALPFAVPAEPDAADAADAADGSAADPGRWRALFGAGWMYRAHRTMAARLPAWVRDHGVVTPAGFDGWPRRQIDAELPLSHRADADGLTGRTLRHVLGTVVEGDGQRTRVLVAPRAQGTRRAVFGARQWSLPRLSTAAGVAAGTLAALATLVAAPALDGAAHGAGAAAASAQVRTPSEPPAVTAATAAAPVPAPATAPVPATAATPPPVSALPHVAAASMPSGGSGPGSGPATTAAAARQAGPMFAIATRALAARADAQAEEALMRGLVASQATPYPTQLELMESRGRWRAVWWPHPDRDHAEGLLLLARERGLRVELVAF